MRLVKVRDIWVDPERVEAAQATRTGAELLLTSGLPLRVARTDPLETRVVDNVVKELADALIRVAADEEGGIVPPPDGTHFPAPRTSPEGYRACAHCGHDVVNSREAPTVWATVGDGQTRCPPVVEDLEQEVTEGLELHDDPDSVERLARVLADYGHAAALDLDWGHVAGLSRAILADPAPLADAMRKAGLL